ncbi:hypothetical protein CRG98_034095 [Punica granatum]|uniref:CCHC-type domain-containing protein n=1 Tax=Punica granatum TaxID=22663 RepID=A0A2I0INB5_PUNGR|nr:hypothetical protein CRG98_034095 [Punica granatum]
MKSAREILKNLRELYGENSRTARYEILKELFRARMQERTEVGAHVQKMIRKDKEVVLVASASSSETDKKKKKSKKGYVPRHLAGVSKNKGKAKVVVDKRTCFHCGKDGHWKRNYSQYLASLKANKGKKLSEGTSKE